MVFPYRQVLAVIHIKGNQHQGVGQSNPSDVYWVPSYAIAVAARRILWWPMKKILLPEKK